MNTPAHCPWCGRPYPDSALVQEFWARDERWFCCWCAGCGRSSDIGVVNRVIISEAVHA
ncbi:hypothetical protein ABZ942_19665 [Nocardia sp. NPDC046473]|uniref:hypothetical protein n=1 Tax=Nocardia sp. NPDC046473 TaxID=3155733 RepID=UPI0033C9EF05